MSARDHIGESQPIEQQPDERELLREEIEKVREDLGETVEALANKADVKSQVQEKVEHTKTQVHEKVEEVKAHVADGERQAKSRLRRALDGPAAPGAVAALCAVLLLGSIVRGRR